MGSCFYATRYLIDVDVLDNNQYIAIPAFFTLAAPVPWDAKRVAAGKRRNLPVLARKSADTDSKAPNPQRNPRRGGGCVL
jgi:hypothetical protein